jgi:hypothetical protein
MQKPCYQKRVMVNIRSFAFAASMLGLVAAAPVFATTITSVSFTPAGDSPFTQSLTATFSGTQADLTGTISCNSETTCTGEVGEYFTSWNITSPTFTTIDISGNLSGETAGSGDLIIATIPEPFAVPAGEFSEPIFSGEITLLGAVQTNYILDLSLPAGQTLTIPITYSAIPEPTAQSMIGIGLLAMIGLIHYRLRRSRLATVLLRK